MNKIKPTNASNIRIDVVIPVLNEAHVLEKSVAVVRAFLKKNLNYRWQVIIVDNGSTDGTFEIAQTLDEKFEDVKFVYLKEKGRGRALREAWQTSSADIALYTDVDLSTELVALPRLIHALVEENYHIAVGSRLAKGSKTKRGFKREVTSRIYNLIVRWILFIKFTDAQCGFKAITREVIDKVVPRVKDQSWFFDTELLVLAEKEGYKIKDIPVTWIENDDSRVKIIPTAWDDLKGVFRLRWLLFKRRFLNLEFQEGQKSFEDTTDKPLSNKSRK